MVPTVGDVGDDGWAVMTTLTEAGETQPEELVTVYV
jgi:hypothetical protein